MVLISLRIPVLTLAVLPAPAAFAQSSRLQALLADRFQLKMHKDKKEFAVYALVQGKGPLKLKASVLDPNAPKDRRMCW